MDFNTLAIILGINYLITFLFFYSQVFGFVGFFRVALTSVFLSPLFLPYQLIVHVLKIIDVHVYLMVKFETEEETPTVE